ncbi:hypothetical protein VTL71DRAFT_4375 [Oculimacula yallundae]|uniref:SHSP domain-containing protein n=1 Tax=Oculimacula yallundae TaxID=86028 RepID=A0ABR4C1T0_9HELO
MPFFQPAYLPEAALMQLLSELNTPSSSQPKCRPQCQPKSERQQQQFEDPIIRLFHRPAPTFTPRFDVTETADSYELYGELPGLDQGDLDIQFVDAQTLVVKGKTDRVVNNNVASPSTSEKEVESEKEKENVEAEEKEPETESETERASLSATVEDDYDEADTPLIPAPAVATPSSSPSSPSSSAKGKGKQPATVASSPSSPSAAAADQHHAQAKYWISERKVGQFARSFTFEQRIEQDFVTAGLKNGILSVVVPKSVRSKRVVVSVL